jgi:hypothetical protein
MIHKRTKRLELCHNPGVNAFFLQNYIINLQEQARGYAAEAVSSLAL